VHPELGQRRIAHRLARCTPYDQLRAVERRPGLTSTCPKSPREQRGRQQQVPRCGNVALVSERRQQARGGRHPTLIMERFRSSEGPWQWQVQDSNLQHGLTTSCRGFTDQAPTTNQRRLRGSARSGAPPTTKGVTNDITAGRVVNGWLPVGMFPARASAWFRRPQPPCGSDAPICGPRG
jgi:hypothetical protein